MCSHFPSIQSLFIARYSFPNNVDSHGLNTARLADVWMDDYKEIFFFNRKELKVWMYYILNELRALCIF